MSDAPREEEIYQALAPGGSYKSGLVNPVAAQQEDTVSVPMRFKGAMGGSAVGNEEYPDHEPRASVPYKHYKDLEDIDPKLHEAVTHVADEIHIPRTDLASLVYANSEYNPQARSGARTGYMGLTPDDARQLDPEGHLDINDPIDNLFMGAMKYKRISNRFGMGTPNAFAAYHGGGDRIHSLLGQDPDEHRRLAPDGTFDFVNKVLGRDGEGSGGGAPPVDDAGGGGDQGGVAGMAAAAQAGAQPQRFTPGQGAVPPMYPTDPAAALAYTTSLPSQVSPYRSYEGPPEAPRPAEQGTYQGPPEVPAALARTGPYYPQEISRPQGAGAGRQPDAAQPTRDVLSDREAQDRATPVPPPYYSRGRPAGPGEPNYDINLNAPPIAPIPPGQGAPGAEQLADRADYPRPPLSGAASTAPEGMENQLPGRPPPELTGQGGVLQPQPVLPERQDYQPPFTPRTSGGYAVGGAIPTATQGTTPDNYPGQPLALASQAAPQSTTGSGAPPAAPRRQAIGTDSMAAQLNQQELARVQGNRPDVVPTGPTQAPVQAAAPIEAPAPTATTPTTTPTTGSGGPAPASTTAPGAGADLPAGAPRALAPPGSTPTTTAAPPIDRLRGNGGAMTPAGAVRAGAEGTGAVLTYIARNGPRGSSIGEGWDHFQDLLERAMIMKGDISSLQHAQEYVFRMKHKGAMENLMQAIGNFDDPNAAAHFLARSHAFVTDGTSIGFQVLGNQIYGQRYDEQTHDKIGKPFQVTEQGLRMQAIANSDPAKFNSNLNTERTTNETGRHNRKTEQHADEQLKQQDVISQRALQEKQIEFEINQKRYDDAAKQRAQEHATATQQRQDIADQQERVRKETQEAQHRQQTAEKEKDRALKEQQAEDKRAAKEQTDAQRAAEEKSARYKYADDATDEYFGRGGMAGTVTDPKNPNRVQEQDVPKARRMFSGILHHDKTINAPDDALAAVQGHLAGKYKLAESVGDDGKRYAHIRDENGNVLATVPADIWRMYLPKQGTVPGGPR